MGITQEELIAGIKEADALSLKPLLCATIERFGPASVGMAFTMASGNTVPSNPFQDGFVSANDMPSPKPPCPLWFGMYPGRVTLLIGETGAGKSSLLYNIAVHAAEGEPLWDFGFPTAQKVLYIDPENSGNYRGGEMEGGLSSLKLERIGMGKPSNLIMHDGRDVNLANPAHLEALKDYICQEHIDIVILDPIANLFDTKDENSNSEAATQGKALTALSRETKACIVVAHHTGKDTVGNYGRGASARLGAADVGMVFRARGATGEGDDTYTGNTRQRTDNCRLQIVKDRPNFFGPSSRYLRMAGDDRFELDTFDNWKGAGKSEHVDKATLSEDEILMLLQDDKEHTRQQIQNACKSEYGRTAIDTALKSLTERNLLTVRRGDRNTAFYRIAHETGEV